MVNTSFPRIGQDSRRHQVIQALREMIIGGRLQPGDRLVETDISEQMGVSRGPVREALRQLEQEGLVVSYPYRGTEVLGISQEEIEQVLIPIRLTLERFSFKHVLPHLIEEDFVALEALVSQMREAADSGDTNQLVEADLHFHEYLIFRSQQTHCIQIWQTIAPRVAAHFHRDAPAHKSPYVVADEHVHLLESLRTGDENAVLEALDVHLHTYVR